MPTPRRFKPSLMADIKEHITRYIKNNGGPYYAAFDADGTLWDSDIGEQFFQYQIDNCNLMPLREVNPWEHYEMLKEKDPREAYVWLAQINNGQLLQEVQGWAMQSVKQQVPKFFYSQLELIKWLREQEVVPIIVTASVKWAVEPAAKMIGIDENCVLGIQTTITTDERVTDIQDGHITWRDGKLKALMERTEDVRPILCAGNTIGDISMIQSSQCIKLAIQTQNEPNGLYEEEQPLFEMAKENGWFTHNFWAQ